MPELRAGSCPGADLPDERCCAMNGSPLTLCMLQSGQDVASLAGSGTSATGVYEVPGGVSMLASPARAEVAPQEGAEVMLGCNRGLLSPVMLTAC